MKSKIITVQGILILIVLLISACGGQTLAARQIAASVWPARVNQPKPGFG